MTSEIMAVYLDAPVSNRQAANIARRRKLEQKYIGEFKKEFGDPN